MREVDLILTTAYTRMVAEAVATRRTAAMLTTTTGTAAPHAFLARDVRAGAAPTPPWRGVYATPTRTAGRFGRRAPVIDSSTRRR